MGPKVMHDLERRAARRRDDKTCPRASSLDEAIDEAGEP